MDIFKEKYTFTKQAQARLDPSARVAFDDLVKEWALFTWEDALVFQLYPLLDDEVVTEEDLLVVNTLVITLRGEDDSEPLEIEDLRTINWQHDLAEDPQLANRLFRTVYHCLNKEDRILAMTLRRTLDPLVVDREAAVPLEIKEMLLRPYNILCAYFFFLLPDDLVYFLFESGFILVGLKTGFDWEKIVSSATDKMVSFNHRQYLCIELSASLSENLTPIGQDINGEAKDIKYWIDNFRIFSKGNFGGQDLFAFLSEDSYLGGCNSVDKDLISQILQLYTHLINGYLAVPNGDLSAVENRLNNLEKTGKADSFAYFDDKPHVKEPVIEEEITAEPPASSVNQNNFTVINDDIRKFIISEFGYIPDGQYKNLEEIIARLAELAIDFNRPEIADLYYFDEQQNKFVWKE